MSTVTQEEAAVPSVPSPPRPVLQVIDPIPTLDTARFEHMQRIAQAMASSSLIPDSLCKEKQGNEMVELPLGRIVANCFLIVNQAVRWQMDPFAVGQCVSVVHGKLCYEGKLIAAVIETKLGIRLNYEWNNETGDRLGIIVSGKYPDESEARTVFGTVSEWKTTGNNSPWSKQPRKQLAYRGAREWARLHAPAIMLGVYSEDELEGLAGNTRAVVARDVTPRSSLAERLSAGTKSEAGFSAAHVESELSGTIAGNGADEGPDAAQPEPSQSEPAASGPQQSEVTEPEPASAPAEAADAPLPDTGAVEPDPYLKGRDARRKGMKRSVVPGEYRSDDDEARENLRLYREGWDAEDSNL